MMARDPLTPEQRLALTVGGRTLDECLGRAERSTGATVSDPAAADRILDEWRRAVAGGDTDAFRRRLSWDGLDEGAARRAIAEAGEEWSGPVPAWVDRVRAMLSEIRDAAEGGLPAPSPLSTADPSSQPPFVELWAPAAAAARRRLEAAAAPTPDLTAAAPLDMLEGELTVQLAHAAELVLLGRLHGWRRRHGDRLADPRSTYRTFLVETASGGLGPVLLEHPRLARQLARLVDTWQSANAELLGRLERDRADLGRALGDGAPPGQLLRLEPGLSDRHHGGRQVAVLHFASGLRAVYKPRSVALEAAFNRFLRWLGAAGLEPTPPCLRVLVRDGYGWVEHVPRTVAGSPEEVRDHYRAAGALLLVAWLLGGGDLHMDNVVAGPGGPVLVDGEALLQPVVAGAAAADSCLASGLLSFVTEDAAGDLVDIGGLCGRGGHAAGTVRQWHGLGTVELGWHEIDVRAEANPNLPLLAGEPRPVEDHTEAVRDGFSAAYRFVLAQRRRLLDADGPLAPFAGLPARVVFRPSNRYALLLERLVTPAPQRLGLRHSFLVDSLNRVFVGASHRPVLWPLVAEERAALEELDLPVFTAATDRRELEAADGTTVPGYYRRSGLEAVHDRLARLGEDDLARHHRALSLVLPGEGVPRGWTADEAGGESSIGPESTLVDAAREIGGLLARHAEEPAPGEASWPAAAGRSTLEPDLGNGLAGVMLFLAALAEETGEDEPRRLARAAGRRLLRLLPTVEHPALGMLDGTGGILYALVGAGRLLGQPELIDGAVAEAARIDDAAIDRAGVCDVEGGVAGAALGLLALHHARPRAGMLERASRCGRRLAVAAEDTPLGGAAWPSAPGPALAGFAHGAAGIALALARLGAATGERAFLELARRGFRGERNRYDPETRNWPLLQQTVPGGPVHRVQMVAWCHGAPGVAMGRLAALDVLHDPELLAEIEVAVATTARHPLGGPDHLCCGNLGRIDVTLTAGCRLERESLLETAWSQAKMVLRRAAFHGEFCLPDPADGGRRVHPGLFHGMAGIGYQLLRLAAPSRRPSLLAFAGEAW